MDKDTKQFLVYCAIALAIVVIVIVIWPRFNVYRSEMDGKAVLAHAKYSREVAVAEARAKMESATMLAAADTTRAHGIARSNQIIGASLKDNDAYLHWLWIDGLDKNPNATIYVPTENNLPIFANKHTPPTN